MFFPLIQLEKQVKSEFYPDICAKEHGLGRMGGSGIPEVTHAQGEWGSSPNADSEVFRPFLSVLPFWNAFETSNEFFPTFIVFKNLIWIIDLHSLFLGSFIGVFLLLGGWCFLVVAGGFLGGGSVAKSLGCRVRFLFGSCPRHYSRSLLSGFFHLIILFLFLFW